MYLHVLDKSPFESAKAHADVHLGPTITACAKLFSTAVIEAAGDKIEIVRNASGIKEFRLGDISFLPPIRNEQFRPWIDWVKADYNRAWWLVTFSWMLQKEREFRFGSRVPDHSDHVRLNLWAQQGATSILGKTHKSVHDVPLVLPPDAQIADNPDAIIEYRFYYMKLQQRTKMRWSGARPKPEWMGGPKASSAPKVCEKCGSDAGACAEADCPLKFPF